MVDKAQVREDYIRGMSLRALSLKYDIPKSTVAHWSKKYGWVQEERPKVHSKRPKPKKPKLDTLPLYVQQKPLDTCTEPVQVEVDSTDYFMIREYAKKVLKKADDLLELDDALAPRDLKSLSSMLLDVRQMLGTLSPLEEEERKLRLAALKKQAQEEQKTSAEVTVRFVDTEGAEV